MVRLLSYILANIAVLTLTACNRGGSPSSKSVIAIRVPAHLRQTIPANMTACFAINVPLAKNNTCGPSSSIHSDFAAEGTDLSASPVTVGQTIEVDLYLYLGPPGTTCPAWGTAMSASQLSNVYLVGQAKNVTVAPNETDVSMTANYTGNNIVSSMSLPAACIATSTGITPYGAQVSSGTASSANIQMNAKVSFSSSQLLSGTGISIQVK